MTSMSTVFNADKQIDVLKEYCCLQCGGHVKVANVKIPIGPNAGEVVKQKSGCNCEILAIVEKRQKKAKFKKIQSIFNSNSLINENLKKATFDNYDHTTFKEQFETAKHYAEQFDLNNPYNLFFQGSFGTGKSHLSIAITKRIMEKGYSAIFISVPRLLTKISNTYNKQSEHTEEQVLDAINDVDLVVFDDLGVDGDTKWSHRKLFEVVDQRVGKHSIFTTNYSSNDFKDSLDLERNFSRVMEKTEIIVMNGRDYRRQHLWKGI